jgi:phospholipid-binding lipoprotein MlaA
LRVSVRAALAAVCLALPLATAAATSPPNDPLQKLNRATYAFNDALDRMLAHPLARAYKAVVPSPVRRVISNFVANINYPPVMVNDALQGKFKAAGQDFLRLLVNTTLGIGGLADPASNMGIPSHDEDFGQTLGHWGVPAGPYLVIPFLGPSDFRDAPARAVDAYTTPYTYAKSKDTEYGLYGLTLLDRRTELLSADTALQNAFDPYVFVRNAYVARRQYLVSDGAIQDDDLDDTTTMVVPQVPQLPTLQPSPAAAGLVAAVEPLAESVPAPEGPAEL